MNCGLISVGIYVCILSGAVYAHVFSVNPVLNAPNKNAPNYFPTRKKEPMILPRMFRVWSLSLVTALVTGLLVTGQLLQAAPIVAGPTTYPTIAIQDIVLFANTPINPGPELVIPGLSGVDVFGINREEQVGLTIEFNSLIGGRYLGSLPGIGDYAFGIVGGLTAADYSGQITNVVQNGADPGFAAGDPSSFVSGDYYVSGDQFGFEFLTGPLTGVILFTDPAQDFSFVSTFDGLPPSPGTTLVNAGDDVLDVLLGNEIVGTSSNRRIIVRVPEPATGILLLSTCLVAVGQRSRRRRCAGK
jgi:hypothetical protein